MSYSMKHYDNVSGVYVSTFALLQFLLNNEGGFAPLLKVITQSFVIKVLWVLALNHLLENT